MENTILEVLVSAASEASSFAVIGGECDELVRFLQLELESMADEPQELKGVFYSHLASYKKYRKDKRDWREDFSGRDFSKLIV